MELQGSVTRLESPLDAPMCQEQLYGSQLDRGHSSVGRAPALHAGGQRFDPAWLHQQGGV